MDKEEIIGYRYGPVFDTDQDADDVDDTDQDDADDDATDGEPDAGALKRELAKTKRALKRANAEAAKHRTANKATTDDQKAAEKRVNDLEQDIQTRDAIEALREAGATGDRAKLRRLVKTLDSTAPDELDDAVAALKDDYPKLFEADAAEKTRLARRSNAGTLPPKDDKPDVLSSTTKKMLGIK